MLAKPQKQKLCNSATPPRILVAAGCERQLMSIKDSYPYFSPLATQWTLGRGLGESHGGKVLWAGVAGEAALDEGDVDWDWGLLAYYPNRAAFIDMVTSPEYLAANEDRRSGVEKHIILSSKTLLLEPAPG